MGRVLAAVVAGCLVLVATPAAAESPHQAPEVQRRSMIDAVRSTPGFTLNVDQGSGSSAVIHVSRRGSTGVLTSHTTGPLLFIATKGAVYLQGGPRFRHCLGAPNARTLGNRWLRLRAGDQRGLGYGGRYNGSVLAARAFQGLTSVRRLLTRLLSQASPVVDRGRSHVAGLPLRRIRVGRTSVWATDSGPLRLVSFRSAGFSGVITRWGVATRVRPPSHFLRAGRLPSARMKRQPVHGKPLARRSYPDRGLVVGSGANGIRLGASGREVRMVLGPPGARKRGRNTFGPYRVWRYHQGFHVYLKAGRVVALSLQSATMQTRGGIGVGSTLAELRRAYDAECDTERSGAVLCTVGVLLPGDVVTSFRVPPGGHRIDLVTVVRVIG
ncbi:MAG: hypothetical protein U0R64_04275 [Candidatus Nanopelagicales bacterium]